MALVTPPVVILVRPQLGENIGAAARAMMNCGLTEMRLVAPRDGWPNPAALPMAAGGASIIEAATVHDSIAKAAHDLTFLAALSARRRDMPVRTDDPRGVTADLLRHGGKAGLMFGPEASGLDNEDVVRADCLVTADLNPDYPSLNLAQAVLLMAWEWRSAAAAVQGTGAGRADEGNPEMATVLERDRFHERLEAELDSGGFFISPEMAPAVKRNLRVLFGRARPTSQEISTLHGVIQALTKIRDRSKSG
ncbi:MAG: RNA methyltransferase [Pseudomonadota bacterium]|nr:RNA methyltransferase [Pseudomonadota bacterium]